MGDVKVVARELSDQERQERAWEDRSRKVRIPMARAAVVRKQVTEAYEILDRVRLDHLDDTAFRDALIMARRGCEIMLGDFLLSASYWEERGRKLQEDAEIDEDTNPQFGPHATASLGRAVADVKAGRTREGDPIPDR